jgi:hypothetical protein
MVYINVLQLEKDKYYIFKSQKDYSECCDLSYLEFTDSEWTKLYKPIKILETICFNDIEHCDVDKYTIFYMDKYGFDNVRGGSFMAVDLEKSCIKNKQTSILFDTIMFRDPHKCIELINDIKIIDNLENYNISFVCESNPQNFNFKLNGDKTYNNLQNIIDDLEIIVNYSVKDIMQKYFSIDEYDPDEDGPDEDGPDEDNILNQVHQMHHEDIKCIKKILPNCRLFFMKTLCELLCKLSASTLSILQNQKTLSFNEVKKLLITSFNEKPKYDVKKLLITSFNEKT